jgi:hypothetical protein
MPVELPPFSKEGVGMVKKNYIIFIFRIFLVVLIQTTPFPPPQLGGGLSEL